MNLKIYEVTTWLTNSYNTHMTSRLGQQTVTIYIVPNISRCKGIQTFLLKNHAKNLVEKLVPDPFL